MKRVIQKNLGPFAAIVGLVAIAIVVGGYILHEQRLRFPILEGKPMRINVELDNAQAVTPGQGQTAQVAGVPIGSIAEVSLKDGRAIVGLDIKPKYEDLVHRDATAMLRPRTGLKDMYVQIFPGHDPALIRRAVDTVERFQGQQRDIMIATFALGDTDAIGSEEEFLLSLNRFNVMASRTRAKLIVLISRQVVDHLASDITVLRESALLKSYVETFCNFSQAISLPYLRGATTVNVPGELRWH